MNFVCIVFELGDKMLTLSSMENLIVQCNLKLVTYQDGCHAHKSGKDTLKILFPGTTGLILMKHRMKHQRPKHFIFCSNYDPGLTLTYFMARSNYATSVFI